MLHEGLYKHYDGFPSQGHPMAILSAMVNAASCYHPDVIKMESPETFQSAAARLLSKMRTIAAAAYKTSIGQPLDLPEAAPRLLLELPAHDVLDPVQGVRAGSGHRRTRCS